MPTGNGYLPPVVALLKANSTDFLDAIRRAKAELARFAATDTKTHLGADVHEFQSDFNRVKVELLDFAREVKRARLGADAAPFWSDIAALRAELAAMSPLDIKVDANTAAALAKIEALRGALALQQTGGMLPADTAAAAGGAGRGGLLGLLGLLRGGGGGGKGPGLAGLLGFGAGAGFLGMAGMGTLGSFAGLGFEHLLMTGVGIAGSAAGAAAGGGLLALGGGATMAVGMGTDLAGIGQASGDIRQYGTLLNNLNRAIAVYGKNSKQAALAQYNMNQMLQLLTPAAQSAIKSASATANAFHAMFDKLTGPAEAVGAQIIQQAMKVGMAFLPTIGKFAAQNMGIIKKDIQPLFSWMKNAGPQGGLGIFKNLEQTFQSNLPTGMHALTQGIELFAKTLNIASMYTGGFLSKIDAFLTRMNSPAGFSKWAKEIDKLIGDFHVWAKFIVTLGKDIYELFHHDAGTGIAIIQKLTSELQKFHTYITSSKGGAAIHNLFAVHKGEVLALLSLLPKLVSVFGKIELAIAPTLVSAVTHLVNWFNALLHLPVVGKLAAYGAGFLLIASRMKLLGPIAKHLGPLLRNSFAGKWVGAAIKDFGRVASEWASNVAKMVGQGAKWVATSTANAAKVAAGYVAQAAKAFAGWVAGFAKMIARGAVWAATSLAKLAVVVATNVAGAATSAAAWVAANALMTAGIAALVALVVAGIIEMIRHWKQVKAVAVAVWHAIVGAAKAAWNGIKAGVSALVNFVKAHWRAMVTVMTGLLGGPLGAAIAYVATHWHQVMGAVERVASTVIHAVIGFFRTLPGHIKAAVGDLSHLLVSAGRDLILGLIHGVESMVGRVVGAIKHVVGSVVSVAKSILHIFSPSQVFHDIGTMTMLGMANGIRAGGPHVNAAMARRIQMVVAQGTAMRMAATAGAGNLRTGASSSPLLAVLERQNAMLTKSLSQMEAQTRLMEQEAKLARTQATLLTKALVLLESQEHLDEQSARILEEQLATLEHIQGQVVGVSGVRAAILANNGQMVAALRAGAR